MLYDSEIINNLTLVKNENDYNAIYGDKIYRIGILLYKFLELLKLNDYSVAINYLKIEYKFDENTEHEISSRTAYFLDKISNDNKKKSEHYLNFRITLFTEKRTNSISRLFLWTFNEKIIYIYIPICIIINLIFCIKVYTVIFNSVYNLSGQMLIYSYFILFFIFIAHEFGHSVASKYYNINPKEIGLGFYLFFPVLY